MFSLKDKKLVSETISKIREKQLHLKFMHVCGTHQDTIMKSGLDTVLSDACIDIIPGPGCPVCVTTPREIEEMITLAAKDHIITSYGDMLRVPGQDQSLQDLRTQGCDVRTVYGIEDAVAIARKEPDRQVVFMAVGFETTAPTTAATILTDPPKNFSILNCHRVIPPALKAILKMGEIHLDGFIDPGHVSTIIGIQPYAFISEQYRIPQVVAGFEPLDIVMAVWMLIKQIEEQHPRVDNEYARAVQEQGNIKAQRVLNTVFSPGDMAWRGFGVIPGSGLMLKKEFDGYDARLRFQDELSEVHDRAFEEPVNCRCGELLRGLINPQDCPLFGKVCRPDHPIGPCMVSDEGSCNISFKYRR